MTPNDRDARRFYRLAYQRLEEGRLLLEELERPATAIYLAGYAVECGLKALVIDATPRSQRDRMIGRLRGARGHDVDWLRGLAREAGLTPPTGVTSDLVFVSSWSTDLRYEPGLGDRRDAERFVAATNRIVAWIDERIGR